jgi:hypothetical protein
MIHMSGEEEVLGKFKYNIIYYNIYNIIINNTMVYNSITIKMFVQF